MARNTILIIDDEKENTDILAALFQEEYDIQVFNGGRVAMEYLTKNYKNVAIILCDMVMPDIDGMVLLKVLHQKGISKLIPIIMMNEWTTPDRIKECYANGVADFINKPIIEPLVYGRVKNIVELYRNRLKFEAVIREQTGRIKEQNEQLQHYNDRIIEVMSSIVEFRNLESNTHIKSIKEMSRIIAEMVRQLYPMEYGLTEEDVNIIESASALHDLGKIAISDTILLKPGRLTPDEFEVIKSHTTHGCEMLKQIEFLQDEKYRKVSYNICRHHHERHDGKGYPDGLAGDNIPIEAQIVSIVDAYEALVGERVYRDAFDREKAYNMIMGGECGTFSNHMLTAFSKAAPLLNKVVDKYSINDNY